MYNRKNDDGSAGEDRIAPDIPSGRVEMSGKEDARGTRADQGGKGRGPSGRRVCAAR
jgi:hypothetical protein